MPHAKVPYRALGLNWGLGLRLAVGQQAQASACKQALLCSVLMYIWSHGGNLGPSYHGTQGGGSLEPRICGRSIGCLACCNERTLEALEKVVRAVLLTWLFCAELGSLRMRTSVLCGFCALQVCMMSFALAASVCAVHLCNCFHFFVKQVAAEWH